MLMDKVRLKIYKIIAVSEEKSGISYVFDICLILLILANVVAMILESVKSVRVQYETFFYWFELCSVMFFTAEYFFRLWTSVENNKFSHYFFGRLKFVFTPLALVDLLAILPFYLPFFGIDLRVFRLLRLFRLFRLFKLVRYVRALDVMSNAIKEKKHELLISVIFTAFLLLVVSSLMYYIEREAQPDAFSSIPATMWWGIATLTTVGYGDIYPITPLGKFLGGIIAILGIGLFALPTGILASGFSKALAKDEEETEVICPHCGEIHSGEYKA